MIFIDFSRGQTLTSNYCTFMRIWAAWAQRKLRGWWPLYFSRVATCLVCLANWQNTHTLLSGKLTEWTDNIIKPLVVWLEIQSVLLQVILVFSSKSTSGKVPVLKEDCIYKTWDPYALCRLIQQHFTLPTHFLCITQHKTTLSFIEFHDTIMSINQSIQDRPFVNKSLVNLESLVLRWAFAWPLCNHTAFFLQFYFLFCIWTLEDFWLGQYHKFVYLLF